MWALVAGLIVGACIMFFGLLVGVAISERAAERTGEKWRNN